METLKKNALIVLAWASVVGLAITTIVRAEQASQVAPPPLKEYRIVRSVSQDAQGCIECHAEQNEGIVADWSAGRHAHANITCLDCHRTGAADPDISKEHLRIDKTPISVIVSPKDCSRCHPAEAAQYAKSKHANTLELIWKIDPWLNDGMNSSIERQTGCYHCHGSIVKIENGKLDAGTWPNVGIGRINPDGSRGSCSSCHTRHKFSLAEARKPQACGQCHLGPDHPQVEIFTESKHGAIYEAEGDNWNWNAAPGTWTPGVDYRAPSCSVCHMSGVKSVAATHDVTERLAWETRAPLTIRPSEFKPWPAKTDWQQERQKMETVCLACHSPAWTKGHFTRLDTAVVNYNDNYYTPMKKLIDELYEKKLLSNRKNLDEQIEIDMYELWHHEGRRARFGAAMMAPDYAWWHGFYELKKRCMAIEEQAEELLNSGKPAKVFEVKGSGGDTTRPDFQQ
jgi:nitrate/TMAO reductase-like tetraheme cytochrome c subunit